MIARRNGAVSVCEMSELRNLLGETPEFVHGEPRLSPCSTHKGVLVLECETSHGQDGDSSSEEEESLMNKSTALVQSTVYLITDMERFQPKRRRVRVQRRSYRLLGIKSTTPEELFSRKIEAGEYEEALHLAEVYNLDTDRVYQSQWRNSLVSEETIAAYLSKISKKRWVFEECYERVPDNLSAAKKLIEFGLKITSFSALKDLAAEDCDFSLDENNGDTKVHLVPIEKLTDEQKCLILTRRTLLRFSDRLFTYEKMINWSEEAYDRELYDKFRRQPACLSAVELARRSDHRAVALLLTYHSSETLPYWLTVLGNFPETTSPTCYKDLLPECSAEGEIFPWEQSNIRTADWCESGHFDMLEPDDDLSEFDMPARDGSLTSAVVEEWYRNRVYELELKSNMVDQPLELVKLARERNIKGLDALYNELVTLDVLVYDVGMEDISLRDLEIMTPLQKAQALMCKSTKQDFVDNLRHRLVPFLLRCEKLQKLSRMELLSQFLAKASSKDLTCSSKLFEFCAVEPVNSIVQSSEELMSLALDVIYAYSGTEQLDKAQAILSSLPAFSSSQNATDLQRKVKAVESELRVAEVLKKRGRPLSILYISKHRRDAETARTLFVDLCTAVGTKVPAAKEAEWNELLQDLLLLQSHVFTCVPVQLCYEVHTGGVLGSGSTAVIRTAVRSLSCHQEERNHKPLTPQQSVALVLQAAIHYCDSAPTLTDSNIGLARACLNLITEDSKEIQEEKDLIAALQLLSEFKMSLLPMQVRLCTDRMKLMESCLASRPSAYKDYHKLLSLAHKLRICGNDSRQREGIILVRVANIAFEARDYRQCAEVCQQLVDRQHAVGWEPAQQLAQCGEFRDLVVRQRLITYALVHCPDHKVREIIETRCELEHMRLQTLIQDQAAADTHSEDDDFVDAVTSPQTPSKEFLPQLSSTLQSTTKLFTQLTNSGFWKETFLNRDTSKDIEVKGGSRMERQGFPEFYQSLHSSSHESLLSAQYSREAVEWPQYQLMQALLQASLLQQEKLPKHLIKDIDMILVQFASLVLPEDSCVGVAALLALARPEASDKCFSSLPLTPLTLQLAVYWLALLQTLNHYEDAMFWTPDQVLCWALAHGDAMSGTSQLLNKALTQLQHYEQSKHVETLNCGVDVRRFAWDTQYKTDSILGLALCEERDKLEVALELGEAHDVATWEIVFCHLQSLLTSHSPLLPQRLSEDRLTQQLRQQPDTVINRFQEEVLVLLNGVNYNQLISYYTVLQSFAPNTTVNGLQPKDHIKLIKKVKATSSDIDYLRIVTRPEEVMAALRPALRKETVAALAKLMKELLKALPALQSHTSVGRLYAECAVAQFRSECLSPTCRDPLDQFSAMQTYFQKMSGSDALFFVRKSIFSHQSVLKLSLDTRLSMIDTVIKQVYSHHGLAEEPDIQKLKDLKEYLQQVWNLENPSLKTLKNYLVRLDEACADPDAVSTVVQTALLDASVPSHVLQRIIKLGGKKHLSGYVTDLLQALPSKSLMLTTLLQRVEDCLDKGEKGDSWSILIGPITEKPELPADIRKKAAVISQRLGASYGEELEALRLRTEAVLRTPVQLSQVSDQNSRYLLYKQSLSCAHNWDQLHALGLLLSSWPDVDTSWYLELIETMAGVPSNEVFATLQKLFRKNAFTEEEIVHLVSRIEGCDSLFLITVCLITNYKSLHSKATALIKQLPKDAPIEEDLARRIVETDLLVETVEAPVFERLQQILLLSSDELRKEARNQLESAGYVRETKSFDEITSDLL